MTTRFVQKVRRMIWIRYKALRQTIRRRADSPTIAFVVGCQRSGTTMLSRVFERDLEAKVYGERSLLTSEDKLHSIRLNDLGNVRKKLQQSRVPLIVIKPLVESQRANELLSSFPGSSAIWIYRHYRAVALSNRNRFGANTAIADIRPIVSGDAGNWRSECVPGDVLSLIRTYFREDMNPADAAVLFWCARNELFFEQGLNNRPEVQLVRYEDLVKDPAIVAGRIYQRLDRPFDRRFVNDIHSRSLDRGQEIQLSVSIENHASSLLQRLDAALAIQEAPHTGVSE